MWGYSLNFVTHFNSVISLKWLLSAWSHLFHYGQIRVYRTPNNRLSDCFIFWTRKGLFFFLMMASIFNAFAVTIFACSYDLRKNLAYNELLTQTSTADAFILGEWFLVWDKFRVWNTRGLKSFVYFWYPKWAASSDGRGLYTAPCRIWTKLPSGRRTPLYLHINENFVQNINTTGDFTYQYQHLYFTLW